MHMYIRILFIVCVYMHHDDQCTVAVRCYFTLHTRSSKKGHTQVVELLLSKGTDVNSVDIVSINDDAVFTLYGVIIILVQ